MLFGVGVAYMLNLLKPIVGSVQTVNELTSFPVLGVVSAAFPSDDKREFRRNMWGFAGATACLAAALLVALALNWVGARLTIQAILSLVNA
jgi:hypothetical protein